MLMFDKNDRITAKKALGHPWFSKVKMVMQRAKDWELKIKKEEEIRTPDFTPKITRRDILNGTRSEVHISDIETKSSRKSVPLKFDVHSERDEKSKVEVEKSPKGRQEIRRSESQSILANNEKILIDTMSMPIIKKSNMTFQESKFSKEYNEAKASNNTLTVNFS